MKKAPPPRAPLGHCPSLTSCFRCAPWPVLRRRCCPGSSRPRGPSQPVPRTRGRRETRAERVDSSMDNLGMDVTGESRAALVILAFLQADCQGAELQKELHSLSNEFHLTRYINCNGPRIDTAEVGSLEAELSLLNTSFQETYSDDYESLPEDLHDIQPVAELQGQWNQDAAANIQQVAEEIREIAAQLQESVMAQATNNLMRNRSDSQSEWKTHLKLEVERILRNGTGLEHLPHERLVMALTLTLVKGVCEQAPQLLRSLFNAALQFIR
ncbi:uncharacterized protein LOC133955530 isoform X2 [Platichthys flesus]|uniref:uncharacterized protein LOC133955530 isoform X2 n=1 Tax=Platichthys flesus TaxID=8260 RepID=UPI002DBB6B57|nr:uncharacterized protein LOC133955530 isoform X2 [Platichthys flesus]